MNEKLVEPFMKWLKAFEASFDQGKSPYKTLSELATEMLLRANSPGFAEDEDALVDFGTHRFR